MSDPYQWIIRQPVGHDLQPAPQRRGGRKGFVDAACERCGYAPIGCRKKCAACLTPVVVP